ncbi:class I SAM-dependent methyltransferase [Mycoplasmatota bacterium]|nr:class I SAM-dependent methyltransferase [Mycoplasmatota bacterium]
MKNLKNYLEKYDNPRILDIGSGKGDFIKLIDYIFQDYQEIIGIDIVDYLLEMDESAFNHNPKIKWMGKEVLDTNFPKNSFDIISLSNTLHHIKDIKSMLEQMVYMLKPNGMIIVNELMAAEDLSDKEISHQLLHSFAAKIDHEIGMLHSQVFSKENIIQAIEMFSPWPIVDYWKLETKTFDKEITIDDLYQLIDGLLLNVKDHDKYSLYKEEAESLKAYLKENGFSFAHQLCLVLKKS